MTRPDGGRWGWHGSGVTGGDITGSETAVTAAGSALFGGEGAADGWQPSATLTGTGFNATGSGTVGTGDILAALGGNILVAHWGPGDTIAGDQVVGGDRLLFNMPDYNTAGAIELPNTAGGQLALRNALAEFPPLVAVPEPSGVAILLLGSFGMLAVRRRRHA